LLCFADAKVRPFSKPASVFCVFFEKNLLNTDLQ
jgi:hypothetical protein